MVIMSVDYGDARTGIAVCDPLELLASPVDVIHSNYEPKVIAKIKELCNVHSPELIVVGLPKNMDSTIGERAQKCIAFAQKLEEELSVKTVTWDEHIGSFYIGCTRSGGGIVWLLCPLITAMPEQE